MADPRRALMDLAALVSVRRSRGHKLELELRQREAQALEAERAIERARAKLAQAQQAQLDYEQQLAARTQVSRTVRVDALLGARDHVQTLVQQTVAAQTAVEQTIASHADALKACAESRRQIALNEERIVSLTAQRDALKKRLAREQEEREDDERADSRPQPALGAARG